MKSIFLGLLNLGRRHARDFWEQRLIRSVNIITINCMVCMLLSSIYSCIFHEYINCLLILAPLPLLIAVILLIHSGKIYTGMTLLFYVCSTVLAIFCIRRGENSFTHGHFLSMLLGVSLFYRGEVNKRYFISHVCYLLFMLGLVLCSFRFHWLDHLASPTSDPGRDRFFNFILMVANTLSISLVIVISGNKYQKELKKSLSEQSTLLAEVYHRVKNNMAVIISMMNLKRDSTDNQEVHDALNDCRNRVMSMALVHQRMYQNRSMHDIPIEPYIRELIAEIQQSLVDEKKITIQLDVDPVRMDISKAIPLGLILNELITNAFKHAFHEADTGNIKILLKKMEGQNLQLLVKDNGVGVNDIETRNSNSLGVTLITALSEQLDGHFRFHNEDGLEFRVMFAN